MQDNNYNDETEINMFEQDSESLNCMSFIQNYRNKFQILKISIMHSIGLTKMQGIEQFPNLQEINLSSNSIYRIEGLQNIKTLTILNLSCNNLSLIEGLEAQANSLKNLNLSHNQIQNLQGLRCLLPADESQNVQLNILDMKDNSIASLQQIQTLSIFKNLEELSLQMNPVQQTSETQYLQIICGLPQFQIQKLQKIDGLDAESAKNKLAMQVDQQVNNITSQMSPQYRTNIFLAQQLNQPGRPVQPRKRMYSPSESLKQNELTTHSQKQQQQQQNPSSNPQSTPYQNTNQNQNYNQKTLLKHQQQNLPEQIQLHIGNSDIKKSPTQYQYQQQQYQQQPIIMSEYQLMEFRKQIEDDMENRVRQFEDENDELERLLREANQENKRLMSENALQQAQANQNKSEILKLEKSRDEQIKSYTQLQERMANLLTENGMWCKEVQQRRDETEQSRGNVLREQQNNKDLRVQIQVLEKQNNTLHTQSLQQAEQQVRRSEQIQIAQNELLMENKQLNEEKLRLIQRQQELVQLCTEWEHKYKYKIDDVVQEQKTDHAQMEAMFSQKATQLESTHKDQLQHMEEDYKNNLDLLETEFKRVLTENNDKFKQLKNAFEQTSRQEQDARNLVQVAVNKNNQLEQYASELEQALGSIKTDVQQMAFQSQTYQNETANLRQENDRQKNDINIAKSKEQELQMLIQRLQKTESLQTGQLESLNTELSQLKQIKHIEQQETQRITQQMEDLKLQLQSKNQMLEDKNDTIQQLKQEMQQLQRNLREYSQTNSDYERDVSRLVETIENQKLKIQSLNNKLDEKNNMIELFEGELNQIRQTQHSDIETLKQQSSILKSELQEKEKNTLELLDLLSAAQKEQKQAKQAFAQQIESLEMAFKQEFLKQDRVCEDRVKAGQHEMTSLQRRVVEAEEETAVLVQEIARQQNLAKQMMKGFMGAPDNNNFVQASGERR